ncbi:MAG: CoA transferase [Alphaproteobacteria bacterium]|nr:CoA transferase [Alphaproteobacteria bacterium]
MYKPSAEPGALAGIRVLDFSIAAAGPFGARLLADLGAEVVKIEAPGGDMMRAAPPRRKGRSPYFGQINCGKKSLCLDLKDPRAHDLVLKLCEKTDVVLQNFRPGVMKRLKLGYQDLRKNNPDLIYCSISGYGQEGPASELAAFAPIVHASSGYDLAIMSFQKGLDRPLTGANATADFLAASFAMGAVSAALLKRERTGKGEEIDISMTEAMQNILPYEIQELQFKAERLRPDYRPARAKDGFFLVTPLTGNNFRDLAKACGHPEWLQKFPLNGPDRVQNWELLLCEVEAWAADRTAEEVETIIREGGCPCARYSDVWTAMHGPQAEFRESTVEVEDSAGPFTIPASPLRLNNSRSRPGHYVADLGEHNAEVLQSWLGLSPDETAGLAQSGVLFTG